MSAIEALYIFDEHKYVSIDTEITTPSRSLTRFSALSFSIMSTPIARLHHLLSYLFICNRPLLARVSHASRHSTRL